MQTDPQCISCQWIESPSQVVGGLLWVGKCRKWTVNHYGGEEATLGWLALQPVEHKLTVDELSDEAFDDLGPALGSVQRAMKRVWRQKFPSDPLERIHIVSFMESHFEERNPTQEAKSHHAHMILIPRSLKLGKVIRRHLHCIKQNVPWDDHLINQRIKDRSAQDLLEENIPWDELEKYVKAAGEIKEKEDFMRKLQQELHRNRECTP